MRLGGSPFDAEQPREPAMIASRRHGRQVPVHEPGNVHVSSQQQPSRQPELKLHGPPPGSLRVQAPPVQNSSDEHCESWPHGAPGQMPPNKWASPPLHSHEPPSRAQPPWRLHVALDAPGSVQQHESEQPELNAHGPPVGCLRVHTPPVQNSSDEH